jgi:hypothetical protein
MDPAELERVVSSALARLPEPRAPRTLAPRVMAAIAAAPANTPRRVRNWFTWPFAWQALSAAAFVAVVVGGMSIWPAAANVLDGIWNGSIDRVTAVMAPLGRQFAPLLGAGGVFWRAIEPLALGFVVLIAVMGTACATFGAVLRHVALGGTSS